MKPSSNPSQRRRASGLLLVECVVYVAVFAILLGVGTAAFYFCWDHTRAVIGTADEVESALRAGETWRADVRVATGAITAESTPAGETLHIPAGGQEILYRFAEGELRREVPTQNNSRVLLERVRSSDMKTASRDGVNACCWELELAPSHHNETGFPLRFTFEATCPRS